MVYINPKNIFKQGYLISENKGRWTTYHLNSEGSEYFENRKISLVDTSSNLVDTSVNKVDSSTNIVDTIKSGNKERLKKTDLHLQIMEVCKDEFKSIDVISKTIIKDVKYLKNKIIPELVKSGKLERLYPNINHPNQAYKSNL